MRMKRFLTIALTICLLLSVLAPSAEALGAHTAKWLAGRGSNREHVLFDLLDGDLFDLDLFQNNWSDELKIEKIEDLLTLEI